MIGRTARFSLLALAGLLTAAALQAAPSSGLLLWWRLDEAAGPAADDSATTNDGTHAPASPNGPTPSNDLAPLLFANAQSLSFDGVDDQVTRATVTGLAAGNTPHTLAAWIKVTALPANRAWIALLGNEGAGAHHWLINSAGVTQFGLWNGTAQVAPALPVDGVWRHVVVAFNGTTLTGYLNGTVLTGGGAATFALAGVPLSIGQIHNGENYFNGIVDDVRLYNRALSAAEVQYLAAGNGPPGTSTLTATSAIASIDLSWTAATNGQTYALYRGTTNGGPYPTLVASGLTGLTYNDAGVAIGPTYYYVVVATHSAGGDGAPSLQASAVALPIPPRLNDHDEGIFGDRCTCGATSAGVQAWAALGLLLAAFLRRR